MKRVYIILEDEEYNELIKAKGNKTWKDFLMELLKFKKKIEEESDVVPKDSLKSVYTNLAKALKETGSLMKSTYEEGERKVKMNWEYEAAALLPLFVSSEKLSDEEKRDLLVVMVNAMWKLLEELHPNRAEELKWLAQALRMLALGKDEIYELSIDNFIEALSRRRERSPPH